MNSVLPVARSVVTDRRRQVLLDMLCVVGEMLLDCVVNLQRRPIGLGCEVACACVT